MIIKKIYKYILLLLTFSEFHAHKLKVLFEKKNRKKNITFKCLLYYFKFKGSYLNGLPKKIYAKNIKRYLEIN